MSFRKIRPSFGESSASNPSQSTSESTGSDMRRNRGESSKELESSSNSSKRRRVPESVTRNACINCKKARAKCDGKKPCKRCASRVEMSECVYEIHIKHAKEELVRQIKELRVKDHLTEQILCALSIDENVPEILERLKRGETYESIVEWLGRSTGQDLGTPSPRDSHHSTFETSDHEMGGIASTAFRWTTVTSDTAVLNHLFQLYFAWIHPVHTLFNEGHFFHSYKRQSDQFCSQVLVNALCGMACHLHSVADLDEVDYEQLGGEFSDAVRSSIDPADKSITTVQAFAVMFLIDCTRGKGLRASSYLSAATSSLSSVIIQEVDGFQEVFRNTARGIQNISVEWAQMTFRVASTFNHVPIDLIESNEEELDNADWYFYRFVNDQCPAWPGLIATTNREKSKLIRIIHDITTMMYGSQVQTIAAIDVLQLYRRLVTWRRELPGKIGDVENNSSQTLPHVLSLLILYECTVVQLLRPFLDLEHFPSILVEEVVWNHGQYGLFLLDTYYRTQYTCRYQSVLQMFAVVYISDLMTRFFPHAVEGIAGDQKDGAHVIQLAMEVLMQSRAGFPVAGLLQDMLRRTAEECSVPLSWPANELMTRFVAQTPTYGLDELTDAFTRPTYVQPVQEIHRRCLPSVAAEWAAEGPTFGFRKRDSKDWRLGGPSAEERGVQSLMQVRNLLNTN